MRKAPVYLLFEGAYCSKTCPCFYRGEFDDPVCSMYGRLEVLGANSVWAEFVRHSGCVEAFGDGEEVEPCP